MEYDITCTWKPAIHFLASSCLAAELFYKANRQSNRFCSILGFLFSIARQLENNESVCLSYKGHCKKKETKQCPSAIKSSRLNTWKESIIDESGLVQNHEMFFWHAVFVDYQHENKQIISLGLLQWVLMVLGIGDQFKNSLDLYICLCCWDTLWELRCWSTYKVACY